MGLLDFSSPYAGGLLGNIDPMTGGLLANDSAAQGKFNRITDAIAGGLRNTIEMPGRAMQNGMTTGDAVNWAAPMALGMVGSPMTPAGALGSGAKVIDMGQWQLSRELAAIKQRNLRDTFADSGGGVIQELPNQWSIGYLPGSVPPYYHSHVLVSPQGSAALYGRSPTDLVRRGFPDEEIPGLLGALRK